MRASTLTGLTGVPWLQSLEARVLTAGMVVCGACLAGAIFVADRLVSANELRRGQQQLEAARATYERLVRRRAENARAELQLIVELPILRALLTDVDTRGDVNTLSQQAEHYRARLGASACIITDGEARPLGVASDAADAVPTAELAAMTGDGLDGPHIVAHQGQLYLAESAPALFATEVLGRLVAAFRLDDALLGSLRELTQTDVTLATARGVSAHTAPAARCGAAAALRRSLTTIL